MSPLKSYELDGYGDSFYQAYWSTVGGKVNEVVLKFLNGEEGLDFCINFIYIVLIPKVNNPVAISDYRPTSLCNVFYKLISKVLANRLKKVLPNIISSNQSAFIPRRLITDNTIITYEALHRLKKNKGVDLAAWHLNLTSQNPITELSGSISSLSREECGLGQGGSTSLWSVLRL